ncbi:1-acyl-sn-glycerol-3-phosphate acyltransferase [Aurantibacter crassamenti]|uniref:lysophospholipid acyltransferase family protein n=1 Tax=Aurantibacter crassamenti TaxID=1837375 RepID=UPI001939DDD0|nr:lysophospholipid acyltransferase family protein [Aurantibacter crassamenti]MBM1106373.1 1-acyl-sn-glycerol-3-phosphate acyltransferase [Aurantibacter crassamenti]
MKNIIYKLLKFWIRTSLHLYYGKIKLKGLENVPIDKPVLFLPNHQNALLDPLLIAVDCNRKPYFLTRSDVFKTSIFKSLFEVVRMIPIYRIRDGRDSLKYNDAVFEKCAKLLVHNESLLMFPEANHNLQRRVRPLSKGFTRILFRALELQADLDIQLVPVGLNYLKGEGFPDKVAIYFGKPIALQDVLIEKNERESIENIKQNVSQALQSLTTHIAEDNYEETIEKLSANNADFLNPIQTNKLNSNLNSAQGSKQFSGGKSLFGKLLFPLFVLVNLPVILLWKLWLKPKVWEPEFTATLRFALSLIVFPIYYLLLFAVLSFSFGIEVSLSAVLALFVFNWAYVKLS